MPTCAVVKAELGWLVSLCLYNSFSPACCAAVDGDDLNKHIAGHSCISRFWAAVKPIMAAHHHTSAEELSEHGQRNFLQACNEAFADLSLRLSTRETNSHSWQQLTKQACRFRAHGSDSDEEDGSFESRQVKHRQHVVKWQWTSTRTAW